MADWFLCVLLSAWMFFVGVVQINEADRARWNSLERAVRFLVGLFAMVVGAILGTAATDLYPR